MKIEICSQTGGQKKNWTLSAKSRVASIVRCLHFTSCFGVCQLCLDLPPFHGFRVQGLWFRIQAPSSPKPKPFFPGSSTRAYINMSTVPCLLLLPLIIAHCFRIADSWHCCKRILVFSGRKPVIWHDWWLHFGVLGDPGPILGHWGTQQRTL